MQTNPFHARPRAAAPGFWHDNTQCHVGQHIATDQQQAGMGTNTRHCPWCASLNEPLRNLCAPQVGVTVVQARARCRPSAAHSAWHLPLT
ncbi:hypothetical protein [Hymenobacter bucti]|uniref:Uncharacterized protein n=1 Tax=Hymenobacter bucti TaxID=1844114 RepID=A0ABW4QX98_9BACT